MSERALWLWRAGEAMQEEGDADFRAMLILEAVERLGPLAETPAEVKALARLVQALRGLEDADEQQREEILASASTTWLAFELTWRQ